MWVIKLIHTIARTTLPFYFIVLFANHRIECASEQSSHAKVSILNPAIPIAYSCEACNGAIRQASISIGILNS